MDQSPSEPPTQPRPEPPALPANPEPPTLPPRPPPATRESFTNPRLQVPLFGADYLAFARRQFFTRHPDYLPTLLRLLDVHPGMTCVEVGCGTGIYTRLIASQLRGEGQVIGIDADPALLAHARQATRAEGWDEIAVFHPGEPVRLPLPDGVADLVFANGALWVLPEAQRIAAVQEMRRVTKPGGRAVVAEPDGGLIVVHDPQRPRLQALEANVQAAFSAGVAALDGQEYMLGRALPAVFRAAGFERLRLYPRLFAVAGCDLGPDPRQGLLDRVVEYQQALATLTSDHPDLRARREHRVARLRAGGMTDEEIVEHEGLSIARLRDLTERPERILEDTSVYLYGGLFCEGFHV